jgi:HAD superfamily hydrolase (TIGR01509 family)
MRHTPTGPELYRQVLAENGHVYDPEVIEAALVPARELYVDATRSGRDFEASMAQAQQFWHEYNAVVLNTLGLEAAGLVRLSEAISLRAWSPECWEPFEDSLPALEALRGLGVRMAVISNFVDTLEAVCARHQLTQYFDVILPSVVAGTMKPDPRIFHLTLRRLGVAPEEAWHVGDNYWADILGARAAGLTAVLVDRERAVPHPDGPVLHSLDELPGLLAEAEAEAA